MAFFTISYVFVVLPWNKLFEHLQSKFNKNLKNKQNISILDFQGKYRKRDRSERGKGGRFPKLICDLDELKLQFVISSYKMPGSLFGVSVKKYIFLKWDFSFCFGQVPLHCITCVCLSQQKKHIGQVLPIVGRFPNPSIATGHLVSKVYLPEDMHVYLFPQHRVFVKI